MNQIALLLSVAVSVALAQTPCDSPDQWSAVVYTSDDERGFYLKGVYNYDATNQRTLIVETDTVDGSNEILRLHATKTQYIFNVKSQKCEKRPINTPWNNFGVPKNATFKGTVQYGAAAVTGANLAANVFEEIVEEQGRRVIYNGLWTQTACIPLEIIEVDNPRNAIRSQFFNVVPGIADPSIFRPRKECQNL